MKKSLFALFAVFALQPIWAMESASTIPHQDYEKISHAFRQAFGTNQLALENIQPLTQGLSGARIYKITTQSGKAYVARIAGEFMESNLENELSAMQAASDYGYGPKLFYKDLNTKKVILDFIDNDLSINRLEAPFHTQAAKVIRKMHAAKSSAQTKIILEWLNEAEQKLRTLGCVSPLELPPSADLELYLSAKEELRKLSATFADDITQVHHDLNPRNILATKDGTWIIDWETTSRDYFYSDLGVFANFHIYDEAQILHYLTCYFDREPTELELAKFHFLRPFALMLHGLWLASIANLDAVPEDMPRMPYFTQYRKMVRHRQVNMGLKSVQLGFAVSMVNGAIELLKDKNYQSALSLLKTKNKAHPNYIVVGPPGAGKGSFIELLKQKDNYVQIGIGALCRLEIARNTPLGQRIKETVEQQKPLDPQTVREIIEPHIEEAIRNGRPFVIDGYPKSLKSLENLSALLAKHSVTAKCIHIFANDEVCAERIQHRFECHHCGKTFSTRGNVPKIIEKCYACNGPVMQRKGDDQETVRYRLKDYHQNVQPVIDAIKKQFPCIEVDTSGWPMDHWEQFYSELKSN